MGTATKDFLCGLIRKQIVVTQNEKMRLDAMACNIQPYLQTHYIIDLTHQLCLEWFSHLPVNYQYIATLKLGPTSPSRPPATSRTRCAGDLPLVTLSSTSGLISHFGGATTITAYRSYLLVGSLTNFITNSVPTSDRLWNSW